MIVRRNLFAPAAATLWLVLALAGMARVTRAGSLSSSVLGMFPKDVGEVGYADLRTARQSPWFPQFEVQVLPLRFRRFEEFLASAGIDMDKQVEELGWAAAAPSSKPSGRGATSGGDSKQAPGFSGEQVVGIALGNFSPDLVDRFFKKQKLPSVTVRGYTLYAFGSGVSPGDLFFFFFDSNTVAFGHRDLLEALIGVRFGDEESFLANETLSPLVDEVNGQGTFWAALDKNYAQMSIGRMMPEAAQFPGASKLLERVKGMTITLRADAGLDAQVTPHCGSTDDALTLAQLLQAGLVYRRYQAGQDNPDLARAIDATNVSADGDHLKIHTQLSGDLLLALLQRNAFSLQM